MTVAGLPGHDPIGEAVEKLRARKRQFSHLACILEPKKAVLLARSGGFMLPHAQQRAHDSHFHIARVRQNGREYVECRGDLYNRHSGHYLDASKGSVPLSMRAPRAQPPAQPSTPPTPKTAYAYARHEVRLAERDLSRTILEATAKCDSTIGEAFTLVLSIKDQALAEKTAAIEDARARVHEAKRRLAQRREDLAKPAGGPS